MVLPSVPSATGSFLRHGLPFPEDCSSSPVQYPYNNLSLTSLMFCAPPATCFATEGNAICPPCTTLHQVVFPSASGSPLLPIVEAPRLAWSPRTHPEFRNRDPAFGVAVQNLLRLYHAQVGCDSRVAEQRNQKQIGPAGAAG